jgi:hypothetical protein
MRSAPVALPAPGPLSLQSIAPTGRPNVGVIKMRHISRQAPRGRTPLNRLAGFVLACYAGAAAHAADVSDIELRRLFDPTEAELASEAEGRIYIYDGLTDRDVQRALNEEFERVDNMMFIRTRKTDEAGEVKRDVETGEVEYEDDGC